MSHSGLAYANCVTVVSCIPLNRGTPVPLIWQSKSILQQTPTSEHDRPVCVCRRLIYSFSPNSCQHHKPFIVISSPSPPLSKRAPTQGVAPVLALAHFHVRARQIAKRLEVCPLFPIRSRCKCPSERVTTTIHEEHTLATPLALSACAFLLSGSPPLYRNS